MINRPGSVSLLNKGKSAEASHGSPALFNKTARLLQHFRRDERGNMILLGALVGDKPYIPSVAAAATKQKIPICVLGLNDLDNGAFDVNGNPQVDIGCAVQANSNSQSGMTQEGRAKVKAKKLGITGAHKTN